MPSGFLLASLLLALVGAGTVLVSESPIRAAGGLLTAFVGVAAAAGALGVPLVPGFILWVGAGGIGLLLLGAVLVIEASAEERGRRIYNLRATLGLFAAAALWAALGLHVPNQLTPAKTLEASAVADALATDLAPALGVALVALAAALVVAVGLVRRRG